MVALHAQQIQEEFSKALSVFDLETISQLRSQKFTALKIESQARQQRLKELKELRVCINKQDEFSMIQAIYQQGMKFKKNKRKARQYLYEQLLSIVEFPDRIKSYPEFDWQYVKKSVGKYCTQKKFAPIFKKKFN